MQLQQRGYSCGPAALRSVLYVYGKEVTEAAVRKWAGTTPDGTDESGLKKAILHYKFRYKEFQTTSVREASDWLKRMVRAGKPVLLCCDKWDHWTSVVGHLGNKITLFDPAKKKNGRLRYSGLRYYLPTELAERWGCLEPDGLTYYYGIAVLPPKE